MPQVRQGAIRVKQINVALLLGLTVFGHWANGQLPGEMNFTSRYDRFDLQRSGRGYALDGKPIKLGTFNQFMNLFSTEIEGGCGANRKADLTVKAKFGERIVERKFYVKAGIVSDGLQCANVSGEGIHFIPLHRSWFDETTTMTIALRSPVKVIKGEEMLASFQKVGNEWHAGTGGEFPNWEFFQSFTEALTDFVITHRVHASIAEGKPGFTLTSGGKKYEFYKLGATLWVAKTPGVGWLVGSARWTSWLDMEKSQWVDRFASQLAFLTDKSKDVDSRRGALAALEGQWSPSIRDALKQILLDGQENNELKMEAVRMMKQKPSMENMGLMISVLKAESDVDLQYLLTQALRVRNPKGPLLTPDTEESKRVQGILEWKQWWQRLKHSEIKN